MSRLRPVCNSPRGSLRPELAAYLPHPSPRKAPIPARDEHRAVTDLRAWAVLFHCRNRLDGDRRFLMWNPEPGPGAFRLFRTRRECRAYIEERYGYIRDREDLRAEPHGWFLPRAVRVVVNRPPETSTGGSE